MSIQVIPCDFENPTHCEALVNLMNEYITDKMGGGEPYTEKQEHLLIEGLKNHPSKLILFAVSEDQFIGLINSFVNFATFTVKPFINIHDVIVTRSRRNNGIGRLMINEVIKRASDMGCSKVTLEVRADNDNAKYLYNSLGFHDSDPRQYYWSKYL
ncbi:MAG TPA: GNAT family N-acetyltransferase [Bacteroidales bacterium]|jgi:ribosomal protein S18 acetylase RimI-like enzyme|nr:GNAT family N-acetyltransferase [Bacteroidales bacterium]